MIELVAERQARTSAEADRLRDECRSKCELALSRSGDDITGYAIVVWDKIGNLQSVYNASQGPIGPALMPTLVADALNRHVAVMLAKLEIDRSDGSAS